MKSMPEFKCVSGFLQKMLVKIFLLVLLSDLKALQGIPAENIPLQFA